MEQKSKEEVLKNKLGLAYGTLSEYYTNVMPHIREAMDEYAKSESIGFAKWITGSINPIYIGDGNGRWQILRPTLVAKKNEIITDDQLYELYQQSKITKTETK